MGALQLWALGQNGELQFLHVFAQTAAPVSSITLHPSGKSILMALADGSISLWQLDTLSELYRYKHEGPVRGLTFTDTDDFYFFSGQQVPSALLSTYPTHAFTLGAISLVHGSLYTHLQHATDMAMSVHCAYYLQQHAACRFALVPLRGPDWHTLK